MKRKPKVEEKVLEAVRKAGRAVSVEYVADSIGVHWHTARALLFRLVAEGKLTFLDTTKGPVFLMPRKEKEANESGEERPGHEWRKEEGPRAENHGHGGSLRPFEAAALDLRRRPHHEV